MKPLYLLILSLTCFVGTAQHLTIEQLVADFERGPFKVTRLGWVQKAMEHINHHRGQTGIYLRLSGVAPPQYKLL